MLNANKLVLNTGVGCGEYDQTTGRGMPRERGENWEAIHDFFVENKKRMS